MPSRPMHQIGCPLRKTVMFDALTVGFQIVPIVRISIVLVAADVSSWRKTVILARAALDLCKCRRSLQMPPVQGSSYGAHN